MDSRLALMFEYGAWRHSRREPGVRESLLPAQKAYEEMATIEDIELTRRGEPLGVISEPVMVDPIMSVSERHPIHDDESPVIYRPQSFVFEGCAGL